MIFLMGNKQIKYININVPVAQNEVIKELGLPLTITVRFVAVILSTGEIEVLMTSILDSNIDIKKNSKNWLWL